MPTFPASCHSPLATRHSSKVPTLVDLRRTLFPNLLLHEISYLRRKRDGFYCTRYSTCLAHDGLLLELHFIH